MGIKRVVRLVETPLEDIKLTVDQYNKISNAGWSQVIPWETAIEYHKQNVVAWKKAAEEYKQSDRPLRILAVHGSSRTVTDACAAGYAGSHSMYLLQQSLEVVKEIDPDIEVEEVHLADYNIEPCWNCVAVTSGLCGAPCDCHPIDEMHKLYPKVIRSDIMFCSTGVNQSAMSTRLKAFLDRLISVDGGFFREEPASKDEEFITKVMLLAEAGEIAYDQRMYGRVGGYFIASKDDKNDLVPANHLDEEDGMDKLGYVRPVAFSLKDGMESFGFFHDPMYFAAARHNPHIDYMYDRETLVDHPDEIEEGKEVVRRAIALAKKLKEDLPPFVSDRVNRT